VIETLAVILLIVATLNLYFVRDGYQKWRVVPDSRILQLFLLLKVLSTGVGLGLAYVAAAFLFGVRPVPGGGIILTISAFALVSIPGIIHLTIRFIENS
jgi:hypothetical protein